MYEHQIHRRIKDLFLKAGLKAEAADLDFYTRLLTNCRYLYKMFMQLYGHRPDAEAMYDTLINTIMAAYAARPVLMRKMDKEKLDSNHWFVSNKLVGMSLYVDRFAGSLKGIESKLEYLNDLGVNLLHLMPIFESPPNESDGGYAVSDFRKVDDRFGTLDDLLHLRQNLQQRGMCMMLDIVLNHTSHHHEWANQAKQGNTFYKDFYYFFPDRQMPDRYEATLPEIFPESAPGSFTWVPELKEWVMTVFHNYQWDLNYTNPAVLVAMLGTVFFYANLGVDVLRIDAPAFIWKRLGTTSQNLPEAHTLLRIIKLCVEAATPGMALLGEAIVAPAEIMKYFGTDEYVTYECDFAYNATHMALQWDALATGDTRVMMAAQHELLKKPIGTSWITYTRCHDDIGLGYDDYMIQSAGYQPYEHRRFIKDYFSGVYESSPAKGALFAVNPKNQDARISGSLASLCGLEKAMIDNDPVAIETSIKKIVLMQAHSFFLGGLPMIFYGDECGTTNDYSYLEEEGKYYDNRWMHRPVINWKNLNLEDANSISSKVFSATRQLTALRKKLDIIADHSNLVWMTTYNIHVAGFIRYAGNKQLFCIFNFSPASTTLSWKAFTERGLQTKQVFDHYTGRTMEVGNDRDHLMIEPYDFHLLEAV